ncbi:MAG: hypothetical protein P8N52_04940 [Crocinitomicaceae bacterium]|nr:hypothetical protein [Crocinitomicaceae bacterium]
MKEYLKVKMEKHFTGIQISKLYHPMKMTHFNMKKKIPTGAEITNLKRSELDNFCEKYGVNKAEIDAQNLPTVREKIKRHFYPEEYLDNATVASVDEKSIPIPHNEIKTEVNDKKSDENPILNPEVQNTPEELPAKALIDDSNPKEGLWKEQVEENSHINTKVHEDESKSEVPPITDEKKTSDDPKELDKDKKIDQEPENNETKGLAVTHDELLFFYSRGYICHPRMVSNLSKDIAHTKLIKENDINLNDYKNIECNVVIELNNEAPDSLKFDSIIAVDEIKGFKVSNEENKDALDTLLRNSKTRINVPCFIDESILKLEKEYSKDDIDISKDEERHILAFKQIDALTGGFCCAAHIERELLLKFKLPEKSLALYGTMYETFASEQETKPGKKGISEILIGFVNKFYSNSNDLKKYHKDAIEHLFAAERFHDIVKNYQYSENSRIAPFDITKCYRHIENDELTEAIQNLPYPLSGVRDPFFLFSLFLIKFPQANIDASQDKQRFLISIKEFLDEKYINIEEGKSLAFFLGYFVGYAKLFDPPASSVRWKVESTGMKRGVINGWNVDDLFTSGLFFKSYDRNYEENKLAEGNLETFRFNEKLLFNNKELIELLHKLNNRFKFAIFNSQLDRNRAETEKDLMVEKHDNHGRSKQNRISGAFQSTIYYDREGMCSLDNQVLDFFEQYVSDMDKESKEFKKFTSTLNIYFEEQTITERHINEKIDSLREEIKNSGKIPSLFNDPLMKFDN